MLSEIRKGTNVKSLCANVSSELLRDFHYALVWGTSAKHAPQRCGLAHNLEDQDVVQIVSKGRTVELFSCCRLSNFTSFVCGQVAKTVKQQQQDKSYSVLSQAANDKHAKKRLDAKKQKQKRLRG